MAPEVGELLERSKLPGIDACDLGRHEQAELAVKAFELSQSLTDKWDTADIDAKRRILEILWLNCTLVDVSLVPEWRKPFDLVSIR